MTVSMTSNVDPYTVGKYGSQENQHGIIHGQTIVELLQTHFNEV